MEATAQWTQSQLDGVHLVLCDNYEHLFRDRDYWEDKYQYEFDRSELREYVSEWQDAVLRELDKLGTVEIPPDERERRWLPEYITDHVTVEYRDGGIDHWNGYRNGSNGGVHVATGLIVVLPEWETEPPHYGKKREPLMRAMAHAACDAHDWITERIERQLLGEKAAQSTGQQVHEQSGVELTVPDFVVRELKARAGLLVDSNR